MNLDQKQIKKNQARLARLSRDINHASTLHRLASDPTRLKIITLLKKNHELCVSELASILNITISAVSHQLALLERHDIVYSEKMGQTVCYYLNRDFKHDLLKL